MAEYKEIYVEMKMKFIVLSGEEERTMNLLLKFAASIGISNITHNITSKPKEMIICQNCNHVADARCISCSACGIKWEDKKSNLERRKDGT